MKERKTRKPKRSRRSRRKTNKVILMDKSSFHKLHRYYKNGYITNNYLVIIPYIFHIELVASSTNIDSENKSKIIHDGINRKILSDEIVPFSKSILKHKSRTRYITDINHLIQIDLLNSESIFEENLKGLNPFSLSRNNRFESICAVDYKIFELHANFKLNDSELNKNSLNDISLEAAFKDLSENKIQGDIALAITSRKKEQIEKNKKYFKNKWLKEWFCPKEDFNSNMELEKVKSIIEEKLNSFSLADFTTFIEEYCHHIMDLYDGNYPFDATLKWSKRVLERSSNFKQNLKTFSPLTYHKVVLQLVTEIGINYSLSNVGANFNYILDLKYLDLLPFCDIFISNDKQQTTVANVFKGKNQVVLDHEDFIKKYL